jgi:hypothetical protein
MSVRGGVDGNLAGGYLKKIEAGSGSRFTGGPRQLHSISEDYPDNERVPTLCLQGAKGRAARGNGNG